MQRAIKNKARTVRVPMSHHDAVAKYGKVEHDIEAETGRRASVTEVARRVRRKGTAKQIRRALDVTSVDTYELSENGSATVEPRGVDEQVIAAQDREAMLEHLDRLDEALAKLDDREAFVVRLRFGLGMRAKLSYGEIAQKLGVSQEWARQLKHRALTKLRLALAQPLPAGRGRSYLKPNMELEANGNRNSEHAR